MHYRVLLSLAALAAAFAAHAAPGNAPPLPPATANVAVMPGMNPAEMKRTIESHKQKDKKRDWTLDDSVGGFTGDGGDTSTGTSGSNGNGAATAPGQQKKP